jgi:RNA polymerase II C-terminal domain phosphatase-like 1/2
VHCCNTLYNSLFFDIVNLLADKYLSSDPNKLTDMKQDAFGSNRNIFGYSGNTRDDMLPLSSTSEESRFMKMEENNFRKTGDSVTTLKELVSLARFVDY